MRTPTILFAFLLTLGARLPAESLSLDQALSYAAEHNPTLREAKAAREQARARKLAAYSAFLPKVALSAGQSQSGAYNPWVEGADGFTGGSPGTSLGLNGSLSLFRGLGDLASLRQAEAALGSAEQDLRLSMAQVAYSVRVAWARLLYGQAVVLLSNQTFKRRADNSSLVQLRYDVGSENKGSLLQAQAQALQAEVDEASSQRRLSAARRALARALGHDTPAGLVAEGAFPKPDQPTESDDKALSLGLPATIKARLAVASAKAALAAADAAFWPSLSAQASLNRSGQDWLPQRGSWSTGLNLSWNLFNGLSDVASHSSSRQSLLAQEAALENTQRKAIDELASARDAVADALGQMKVRQALLAANEARAEIARARYTQGLIGFQEWDQIESSLVAAQQAWLNGQHEAALSGFSWQNALSIGWE